MSTTRGLATVATCAFVEGCLEGGVRPQWSCWHNNAASLALAEKLGFTNPHEVPVIFAARAASVRIGGAP